MALYRRVIRALTPRVLVPDTPALAEGLMDKVAPGTEDQLVGVRTIRNSHGAAIRVFYPAVPCTTGVPDVPVSVFRNPLPTVVSG